MVHRRRLCAQGKREGGKILQLERFPIKILMEFRAATEGSREFQHCPFSWTAHLSKHTSSEKKGFVQLSLAYLKAQSLKSHLLYLVDQYYSVYKCSKPTMQTVFRKGFGSFSDNYNPRCKKMILLYCGFCFGFFRLVLYCIYI